MALINDVCLTSQETIILFKDGWVSPEIIGFQARLDAEYPDKHILLIDRHPEQRLPSDIGIEVPIKQPILSMFMLDSDTDRIFHKNRVPGQEVDGNTLAWLRDVTVQLDLYARTPPELRAIGDFIESEMVDFTNKVWYNLRVRMVMNTPFFGLSVDRQMECFHAFGRLRVTTLRKREEP